MAEERLQNTVTEVSATIGIATKDLDAIFEDEEFVPDDEAIDVKLIKNILAHNRKPVDAILKGPKPQSWFNSLNEIVNVIVYGHSCSKVDKPYFQKVAELLDSSKFQELKKMRLDKGHAQHTNDNQYQDDYS